MLSGLPGDMPVVVWDHECSIGDPECAGAVERLQYTVSDYPRRVPHGAQRDVFNLRVTQDERAYIKP